jgi:FMN phosphatase YigB (HAD superfamily)
MTAGALAFDYGGTLAGRSPRVDAAGLLTAARARYGDDFPPEAERAWDDALSQERRIERRTGLQRPLAAIVSPVLHDCGIAEDGVALVSALFDSLGDGEPWPGALTVLRRAGDAGFDCLVASNTYRPQRTREQTLRKAGLLTCFRAVLLSSELGVRKPHPDFFAMVIAAAGVAADRIVFIGDTLEKDVLAPLAAGMHAIWVAGGPPEREIAHERYLGRVASLGEIPTVLQEWRSDAA